MVTDEDWMDLALAQARLASELGEVPVGAVIVLEERVVASAHNLRETIQDPTAHAELIALRDAAKALGTWRLSGATCFVTLEPCPMCAGAIVNARVETLVYGTRDPRAGAVDTHYGIGKGPPLNHACVVKEGVLGERAAAILKSFFAEKRQKKNTP